MSPTPQWTEMDADDEDRYVIKMSAAEAEQVAEMLDRPAQIVPELVALAEKVAAHRDDEQDDDRDRWPPIVADKRARRGTRGCCDDVRAENERLRVILTHVGRVRTMLAQAERAGITREARHFGWLWGNHLAAALEPAPHDDTQDGAR